MRTRRFAMNSLNRKSVSRGASSIQQLLAENHVLQWRLENADRQVAVLLEDC